MNNFDHAIEATETALNSAGSAARENSRYMEGLEAKTQAVKASFQELANSVIDSGLVKGILDLANGFLKLLNTPIGNFITQMTLLTGVFWGGSGLIKAMKLIPSFFSTAATAINGFTGVLSLTAPQLMLVAAGISAILAVAPAISEWWKEFTNDVEYSSEKLAENNEALKTNKERLEDLYAVPPSNRTSEMWEEINALEEENKKLEENIAYWEKKNAQGKLEDYREGGYQSYIIKGSEGEDVALPFDNLVAGEQEAIERLKAWGYEYENLGTKIEDFGYILEESNQKIATDESYLKNIIAVQTELQKKVDSGIQLTLEEAEQYNKNNAILLERISVYKEAKNQSIQLTQSEEESIPIIEQLTSSYQSLASKVYEGKDILNALTEGYNLNNKQAEELKDTYPELSNVIEDNNGVWKLNQQALYDVAAQGNETARAMVKAQIEATKQTIASTEQRIKTYMAELEALEKLSGQKILGAWGPSTPAGASANIMNMLMGEDGKSRADVLSDAIEQERNGLLEAKNDLADLLAQVDSWDPEDTNGDGKTSSSKETDPIKEQSDNFKEYNENFEHYIFLREKQGASTKELISLNKEYQNQLKKEADWFRSQGVPEDSEYIRDLQKNWWGLQDTVIDLQRQSFDERLGISENYIEEKNELDNWGADSEIDAYQRVLDWMDEWYAQGLIDYEYYSEKRVEIAKEKAKAEKEAWEEALSSQIEELENQQSAYEKFFSFMTDKIDEQINKLQEQRDKEEEYWDNKIQALEDQNDEIERQIELEQLQQNLAKANQENLLVYKDGKFQYVKNVEAISEAESELEAYEREEAFRQEVENLEKLKEEALDAIDDQIDGWEEYKEQWSSVVDDYQEEQDRLLIEQELGIKLEGDLWQDRLDNLSDYITQYKDLMSSLTVAQNQLNAGYSNSDNNLTSKGETILNQGNQGKDWSQVWWDAEKAYQSGQISKEEADYIKNEAHSNKAESYEGTGATFNPGSGKWEYASGTLSAHGGLSLVGEKGPELRVLNQGDGIIPANATKNLLELSKYSIKDILASKGQAIYSYMFDKLVLPNVTDFNSFVNELKRFKQFAYQQ